MNCKSSLTLCLPSTDWPGRREAALRQCRPACMTSHNHCVTAQRITAPIAQAPITKTEPSNECRSGPGTGVLGSRSEGASIPASHCGRHGTRSSCNAKRSDTTTFSILPPRAAAASWSATWRQMCCSRRSAGKWRAISSRTSASVFSVITVGILSGRGNGRDQFERGNAILLKYATWVAATKKTQARYTLGAVTEVCCLA